MSALAVLRQTIALASQVSSCAPASSNRTLDVRVIKRHRERGNACFQLDATFKLLPGTSILIGRSGAGKTTLLRSIAGLCDPDEGYIAIGDRILFDSARGKCVNSSQRRVGVVFQDLALFPHLTVEKNLAYGLRKLDKSERERRVGAIAESFQIAHLKKRFPRQISGGEQQRLALARSLVTQPDVLLLDEPLSSLDVQTKSRIIEDLRKYNEAHRIPMLYVTHDHSEALALGERVFALEQGRIVQDGSPLDVLPKIVSPKIRRGTIPESGFENLFDATVLAIQERDGLMTCRLRGTSIELQVPAAAVAAGDEVRLGIRADEILLASGRPDVLGACNVLRGRIKQVDTVGGDLEVRVSCSVDFCVHLAQCAGESASLAPSTTVWLIVKPHFCHFVQRIRPTVLQRIFVFVCNANVARSPIAQALCNAEIARRLKVPFEALGMSGVRAVSAGLSANPGEPMSREASEVLEQVGIHDFAHQSQQLTPELVDGAEVIFCMTREQQARAIQMFPSAAAKVECLNPDINVGAPEGHGSEALTALMQQIRGLVHDRLDLLVGTA